MGQVFESDDFFFLGTLLLFTLINFNPEVSVIYLFMTILSILMYYTARDKNVFPVIPFESSKSNRTSSVVWGIGAFATLLFISSFILPMLGFSAYSSPQTILYGDKNLHSLFPFSTSPALASSNIMSFLVWGLIIAFIETVYFFGAISRWVAWKLKLDINSIQLHLWIAALFVIFHMTAKGVRNNEALIVTFLFGLASMQLVSRFKELKQAIILHITANSLAMASILYGFTILNGQGLNISPTLIAILIGGIYFLFIRKK